MDKRKKKVRAQCKGYFQNSITVIIVLTSTNWVIAKSIPWVSQFTHYCEHMWTALWIIAHQYQANHQNKHIWIVDYRVFIGSVYGKESRSTAQFSIHNFAKISHLLCVMLINARLQFCILWLLIPCTMLSNLGYAFVNTYLRHIMIRASTRLP